MNTVTYLLSARTTSCIAWRQLRSALLVTGLSLLLCGAQAQAQNAGSNTTGTTGLIAIDKVDNKIRFYDPVTLMQTKVLDSPGRNVHELALSYDHRTAWVPLYGNGIYGANTEPNHFLLVIDLQQQALSGQIDTAPCVGPHGIAVTRAAHLWVVCDNRKLIEIDSVSRTVIATYDAPTIGTHMVVLLPDESKLYISNKEDDLIAFDLKTRSFGERVPLRKAGVMRGNGSGGEGITPSPDGKQLLIFDNDRSDLHVIDTRTDREIDRVPLRMNPPSNIKRTRLHKLMYSPDGRRIIAVDYTSGVAWIIDARNLRWQTFLIVAKGPMGIAFAADQRIALISSHDSGLITRIDLQRRQVIDAVDGGGGIEVLAYY